MVVEHDLRLIRSADWVLEFGPGSGPDGGQVIFAGSPEQLTAANTPTGRALAGKLPTLERSTRPTKPEAGERALALDEQVARTAALMRMLITGEATEAPDSTGGLAEPIVVVSDRLWAGRAAWEVAGLDREVPKLLLDVQRVHGSDHFEELLGAWAEDPKGWIAIQPFLTDMQVWGRTCLVRPSKRCPRTLRKRGCTSWRPVGRPLESASMCGRCGRLESAWSRRPIRRRHAVGCYATPSPSGGGTSSCEARGGVAGDGL